MQAEINLRRACATWVTRLLCCDSYRSISITSVFMKLFEYALLERIMPMLQENGHSVLIQTAYRKKISCQDAHKKPFEIFCMMGTLLFMT